MEVKKVVCGYATMSEASRFLSAMNGIVFGLRP